MPAILVVFIALHSLAVGHTLLREVADVDFGISRGGPIRARYEAWSAPRYQYFTRKNYCDVVFFATASHRVEILTHKQFVSGTSLKVSAKVPANSMITQRFRFSDLEFPHKVYAFRVVSLSCIGLPGSGRMQGLSPADMEGI